MVNYRGLAVNKQLDETIQLVDHMNFCLRDSDAKHLQRTAELGWGSAEWMEAITTTNPHNAMDTQGITPLDSQVFRKKGKGTTLRMFSSFHGFMSRIKKTAAWDFVMRWPRAWDKPYGHSQLSPKHGEAYVNGMCRLSDAFFLKYAWHVEGEQNVWDVQYRGLSISDDFPLNTTMRLPYPVMWFDAPSSGYTFEPPKKRLHNKLEKSGIDVIYKRKIGGIMLMEVDILPVMYDVPEYKKTPLVLKNMLWQIPDVLYKIQDSNAELNDFELSVLLLPLLGRMQNDSWRQDGNTAETTQANMLKKDIKARLLTHSLPMELVETSISYKENAADMLWDVGNTNANNHLGTVLTHTENKEEHEHLVEDFPKKMENFENGFLTVKYDSTEDKLDISTMQKDDFSLREMYHVRINNFPSENQSVQGVMMARKINPLGGDLDLEMLFTGTEAIREAILEGANKDEVMQVRALIHDDIVKSDTPATLSSINKRRKHLSFASNSDSLLLPQFMVTGFNDESIRSENSMQSWTHPDFEKSILIKGNRKHNWKGRDTKRKRLQYLERRLDRLTLNLVPGTAFKSEMRLVWPAWRAIRDDFFGEKYGWELYHRPPEDETVRWPFAMSNALLGLRYNPSTSVIDHCIDSVFKDLEEFGMATSLFPDFDEKKEHLDTFLTERKKQVKETESEKLTRILDMSNETALEYKEYGDYEAIKNMLVRSKSFCNVPYDTYNYINDDNIQRRIVESFLCSKYWVARNGLTQRFCDEFPTQIHDKEENLRSFWTQSRTKGPLCTYNNMSITMQKTLRRTYAQTLRWHDNEAAMGRKLILASVYATDGSVLMQLPIPPLATFSELMEYADNIWAYHGIDNAEDLAEKLKEVRVLGDAADEIFGISTDLDVNASQTEQKISKSENTWIADYDSAGIGGRRVLKNLYELDIELNNRLGTPASHFVEKKQEEYLEAHKHFGKETMKLVIGLLEFMNRPEVHIDARPFEIRRGAKLRGKGNKYKAERVNKEEENLMRKNHVLRRTGVVKKYLDMAPITDSRGKMKRHYVPTHSRMQPYPTRGTIEKIWVDGYYRGEGEITSRPRIRMVDKRKHGEEE